MKNSIWRLLFLACIFVLTTGMSKKTEIHLYCNPKGLVAFAWGEKIGLRLTSFTVSRLVFDGTSFDREPVWSFVAGSESCQKLDHVNYGETPENYREVVPSQELRVGSIYEVACSGDAIGTIFFIKAVENIPQYYSFRHLEPAQVSPSEK